MPDDTGDPIAYTVLAEGTPVHSSDDHEVGRVKRVLADDTTQIFDGIVVDTEHGERFVDAPEIRALYERAVVLTITASAAGDLPEHTAAPAVVDLQPDDVNAGPAGSAKGAARKVWDRLTGNY